MSTDTPASAVDEAAEHLGDALFTYCLSVLCDQDEALTAVREVKQLAIRHGRRLRRQELQRAWLYALARYVCLVRLERGGLAPVDAADPAAHPRLARLAWPEAAGTTPEQRELLELTGRHQLDVPELAAVLDLRAERAMQLLAEAERELERTAAALALLAADACPELTRLGRDRGPVLAPVLRGELVRHLDSCPTCRGAVERGRAEGPWPGTLAGAGTLPLIRVPRRALKVGEGFFARGREPVREPVFDRRGFPVHRTPEEQRALTTRHRSLAGALLTAAVLTPVGLTLALHGAPAGSAEPQAQGPGGAGGITGVQVSSPTAGPTGSGQPAPAPLPSSSTAPAPTAAPPGGPTTTGQGSSGHLGEGVGVPVVVVSSPAARSMPVPPSAGAGRLVVTAGQLNGRTVLTLSNPGGAPVSWRATPDASWLRLSRDAGVLAAGEQATVLVTVDDAVAPDGSWSAHVRFAPNGTVVTVSGSGHRRGLPSPSASATSASPTPTPTPTQTSASPTPSDSASGCPGPTDCPSPSTSATPAG